MVRKTRKVQLEEDALSDESQNSKSLTADLPIKRHRPARNYRRLIPYAIIILAGILGFAIPALQRTEDGASEQAPASDNYSDYAVPISDALPQTQERTVQYVDKKFVVVKSNDVGYLNVRADASTSSARLGKLNIGSKVEYVKESTDWVQIKLDPAMAGKSEGWVAAKYVDIVIEKVEVSP